MRAHMSVSKFKCSKIANIGCDVLVTSRSSFGRFSFTWNILRANTSSFPPISLRNSGALVYLGIDNVLAPKSSGHDK